MENFSQIGRVDEEMDLPPGFRFHPTDEELITHYLLRKVLNSAFEAVAIAEADLNQVEPWDLPRMAKMGEKEWYFFSARDRKYPTGMRTNRATEAGYWKATGKDKEIYESKTLVGMKKTLVFYTGRAPKGEKTNWVIHEYRLEGKYSRFNLPKTAQNEWVISRVFEKSSGPKPNYVPSFENIDQVQPPVMPPLMDSFSPCNSIEPKVVAVINPSHVTCFSGLIGNENQKTTLATTTTTTTTITNTPTTELIGIPLLEDRPIMSPIIDPNTGDFEFIDSIFRDDELKLIFEGTDESYSKVAVQQEAKMCADAGAGAGAGADTDTDSSSNAGVTNNNMLNYEMYQNYDEPIDLDVLWGY